MASIEFVPLTTPDGARDLHLQASHLRSAKGNIVGVGVLV